MRIFLLLLFFINLGTPKAKAQIEFDYSGVEIVLKYFSNPEKSELSKIIKHAGYQHIIAHSLKFSSNPLTEDDFKNSLQGLSYAVDFANIQERLDSLRNILNWLKENEAEIKAKYGNLPLQYLPPNYIQKATIYYVVGGYNGIAYNEKICVNIDYTNFRKNNEEIKYYVAHELFHIGFEKHHTLPDIFKAKRVSELSDIVMLMTMNEGLATLTPYTQRITDNEISDYDYRVLLDSLSLNSKVKQFENIMIYLHKRSDSLITKTILGKVLGECSVDRLFYIVGCHMGLEIEKKIGKEKLVDLIEQKPEVFFETYKNLY